MITLLARRFIRDHNNVAQQRVRVQYGALCGAVGIALNVLLFLCKMLAGARAGSIAITADALNNLSDVGSSVVTLAGFRIAGAKADEAHPFGHGRVEYIAGLIVSLAMLVMGFELIKTSVEKIVSPVPVQFSHLTVLLLIASILVKLYMYCYNRRIGGRIDSAALHAAALDSVSDAAATGVVLLAMLVGKWTGRNVDGWAGLLVALFILYSGIVSAKETISPLLGQKPSQAYVNGIERLVLQNEEIIGMHDLVVHDYGPGRVMVTLHAEVPADGNLIHLHDTVDNIEKALRLEMGCTAVIHMDPVVRNDEQTNRLRAEVVRIAHGIDPSLSVHDFRVVAGHTHTNLVFDVVVPYRFSMSNDAVKREIESRVRELDGACYAVVEIDNSNAI